jgi:hypothetical protein
MHLPLLLLWSVPLVVAVRSRRLTPNHLWRNTGAAFGLVVSPASLGLYSLYYVGPVAAVFGMLGLVLLFLHGTPGYKLAVELALVPSHTVVTGVASISVELLNAIIWSAVYGSVGWLIDRRRLNRHAANINAV